MAGLVSVDLLKPHPKNGDYFEDPTPEEYEQIKHSVAEHGIRDPLKVLPDYTVVAGCLRLRVAKELGLTHVPVEILDISGEEAEYRLVADNEERHTSRDRVKKAKCAEFLRRYWGVREGKANPKGTVIPRQGQNVPDERKTLADVADLLGESEKTVKRLLKLNDLIPPLQRLVSAGLVPQTVGYYLAFATPEEQEELLAALGEAGLGGLSAEEARRLKQELEAQRARAREVEDRMCYLEARLVEAEEGSREAEKLAAELERLRAENERLKARPPEVVERIAEKAVRDPEADRQIATLQTQYYAALVYEDLERITRPDVDRAQ